MKYEPKLLILPNKNNFPEKAKNNRSAQIGLKYRLCSSLLSTFMTYVKNISNWCVPGGAKMGYKPKLFTLTA